MFNIYIKGVKYTKCGHNMNLIKLIMSFTTIVPNNEKSSSRKELPQTRRECCTSSVLIIFIVTKRIISITWF